MGIMLSVPRFIQGNYSGNTGSNNIFGSNNINNYYDQAGRDTPESYTKILQQLYLPGSGYKSHRNRVPQPVKGTCTWVIDHPKYREWLDNETSGLLWLSADPGCGKSVIASFLVNHLETHTDAIVCYFFFKDDNEEQKSATFALCAILHQLFEKQNSLCSYAEAAFKSRDSRFTKEVDTLWDILVKAVAEGGCGDVICVIDALDECEEATLDPLIRRMTGPLESQPSGIPLKFLVTSRPYHRIEKKLCSPATTIRLKGEEEVSATTADVNRVIDEGIEKLEAYWGNPGRLKDLRDLLKWSADRTFLWVSLVLEILGDNEDGSEEEFTNIANTAPPDLAQFYTSILDRSKDRDKARRILHIVVAAARPLTLREINVAFRIRGDHKKIKDIEDFSPGFEKTVKNLCGLFVRVIEGRIYLVHQTAREFLIKGSSPGQGNWQYTLCSMDSNFVMADICMSYLALEDFENDPLPVDTEGYAAPEAVGYLKEHALLNYSATHWPRHFRDSEDRQIELFELTRSICVPRSNRLQTWFELYWREGFYSLQAPNGCTHLMIASWLGQGKVVERLLEDGEDMDSRCDRFGTALNIAARHED